VGLMPMAPHVTHRQAHEERRVMSGDLTLWD
jgi:hypothetical protein